VIDQKLEEIKVELSGIKAFVKEHQADHDVLREKVLKHDMVISALIFVAGLLVAGVIKLIFFTGG